MTPFTPPERCLTRAVSARYADCLRDETTAPIDVARARAQQEGYVAAVRALGIPVETIPTDDTCPDACFIEDTMVITGAHAVATRPGAESRRAEVAPVAKAVSRDRTVHVMEPPATLDGGDVLRIASWLFVGLSKRTNREGAETLARVAALDGLQVVPVPVRSGLHLRSACALASGSVLLYDPSVMTDADLALFKVTGVELVPAPEAAGANVLTLGEAVILSAAAPRTAQMLRARGLDVRVLEMDELHKGDGALTCLSLRVPRVGGWST